MGCTFSKAPPAPPAPTTKHPETIGNVSSADARLDYSPEIVGHNRKLADEYDVGKQIGKGHYGFVFEAVQKSTGRRVAVKRIDRSMCTSFRIIEEIEILRRVGSHEFVVAMLDAFETPTHVEIVMELMEGGELYGRIASKGPYPEAKAALIIRRLASAVRYLHRHGVVHRDLKPENLLLVSSENDDMIKLADFGLAKHLVNQTHMTTVCGTWAYSAPEVRVFRQPYNYKVDIWSLGVILFTMLGGYHPFDPYGNATEAELQDNMKELKFDFDDEVWDVVSNEAKDLIVSMLRHNPKERPSAKRILMHPWIQRFAPEDTPNKGSSAPDVKASASKPPQVPTRRSVDESVFVDPAAPRGERRSSDQRKDANPASRRESQERRDQGARHGFERNDSNATWTSKSNRTLRPARRAIDTYEPIATSPPHREYREEQQWPPSAAKASAIRAPASALPSASATQWPAPITQPRSVSPRTRGQGGGGPSVGMMVMQRGEHPPAQPMQHSRSKVKMDAGVMFGQHKPPHTSHHLAGTGIIATTPLVLSAHQQQQRGTRASPGRSGRADSFDEEDSGEVEDGWHAHDYKDTLIRAPAHASQRPWGAADPRATAEARAGESWWRRAGDAPPANVVSASTFRQSISPRAPQGGGTSGRRTGAPPPATGSRRGGPATAQGLRRPMYL